MPNTFLSNRWLLDTQSALLTDGTREDLIRGMAWRPKSIVWSSRNAAAGDRLTIRDAANNNIVDVEASGADFVLRLQDFPTGFFNGLILQTIASGVVTINLA